MAHYLHQCLQDDSEDIESYAGPDMPNTLADFPPDRFAIYAFCECGHTDQVATARLPAELPIDALRSRLRCRVCGSRQVSIRIIWTAAGGFHHSGGATLQPGFVVDSH